MLYGFTRCVLVLTRLPFCVLIELAYLFATNRYHDSSYGFADKAQSNEARMRNTTEFENKDFRYVL